MLMVFIQLEFIKHDAIQKELKKNTSAQRWYILGQWFFFIVYYMLTMRVLIEVWVFNLCLIVKRK